MKVVEFTAEITDSGVILIPPETASQLPKGGTVHVIVLMGAHADDFHWRMAAYQQFLGDDAPEDAIYDSCR